MPEGDSSSPRNRRNAHDPDQGSTDHFDSTQRRRLVSVPATTRRAADVDLQAEIDAIGPKSGLSPTSDPWLDETRRAEITGLVQDVLDASERTSLQDDAAIAGWKKGFQLRSPDGNFLLKIGGQFRSASS